MRKGSYERALRQLTKDIFEAAFDPDIAGYLTVNDLAEAAGLSWTTVDNLYRRKTMFPRHATIWKLARAVNMDLTLAKQALEVS